MKLLPLETNIKATQEANFVKIGDLVRLCFTDGFNRESRWVKVTKLEYYKKGNSSKARKLHGNVQAYDCSNDPILELPEGMKVEFQRRDICDIQSGPSGEQNSNLLQSEREKKEKLASIVFQQRNKAEREKRTKEIVKTIEFYSIILRELYSRDLIPFEIVDFLSKSEYVYSGVFLRRLMRLMEEKGIIPERYVHANMTKKKILDTLDQILTKSQPVQGLCKCGYVHYLPVLGDCPHTWGTR